MKAYDRTAVLKKVKDFLDARSLFAEDKLLPMRLEIVEELLIDQMRIYIGYAPEEALPLLLQSVMVSMIVDYLIQDFAAHQAGGESAGIAEIQRGDTTIKYNVAKARNVEDTTAYVMSKHRGSLNRFRRIKMI